MERSDDVFLESALRKAGWIYYRRQGGWWHPRRSLALSVIRSLRTARVEHPPTARHWSLGPAYSLQSLAEMIGRLDENAEPAREYVWNYQKAKKVKEDVRLLSVIITRGRTSRRKKKTKGGAPEP